MKNMLSECLYDIKNQDCKTGECAEKDVKKHEKELEKINEIITKFTSI